MIRNSLRIVSAVGMSAWLGNSAILACPPKDCVSKPTADPIALGMLHADAVPKAKRAVDLAICLDTSGSMEGLINAARQKIWDIVNDLALAKPTPTLRVALLTYGNDGHKAENGWVTIDSPFTEDLDLISQKLFALTTNGGTELVARVLKAADEQLKWTPSDDALKLIIVAGNESADQDTQFHFQDICKKTISNGIMIDSIYCGNVADDIAPLWKEVSMLADGRFAAIDHNNGTLVISTPFDDDMVKLSTALNTTYVPYGALGKVAAQNQTVQDSNAASLSLSAAAGRCSTKGGEMYRNSQWDLVDACKEKLIKVEDVKTEDLPENMRSMTPEQRTQYVAEMEKKRGELQSKVAELSQKRQQFVDAEMKKSASDADKSFDLVIRKAIREQAASKGFTFEEPKTTAAAPQGSGS